MYVQSLPTEVLRQRVGATGNFAAQTGRVPGGAVKGAIDIAFAPAMLAESVASDTADFKQTISEMKEYGERISNLVKAGATRKDLFYVPLPSQTAAIKNNINAWKAGDETALANPLPRDYGYKPSANTSKPVTEWVKSAHQTVDNKTNSWVPEPQTKAAEFGAVVFDQLGRALPLAGGAALTTGLKTTAILRGTPLSYAGAALQGIGTEGAEGSGQTDKMIISGLAEWTSEKLGGKLFSPLAEKASSKAVSGTIDAIGEGLEENISGGIFSALTGTPYSLSDAVYDFAVGASVGGAITTGVNTYNALRGNAAATSNAHSIATNQQIKNPQSTGNITQNSLRLINAPPSNSTTGAKLISLSSDILSSSPMAKFGQNHSDNDIQMGRLDIQSSALPSTPQTEPWKFNNTLAPELQLVNPDETSRTNIIQFPTKPPETTNTPAGQPGEIIQFPAITQSENNKQTNIIVDNQQQINLVGQNLNQNTTSQIENNLNNGLVSNVNTAIETETTIQTLPEVMPLTTTEVATRSNPKIGIIEQTNTVTDTQQQAQLQEQMQEQTQEENIINAAQIWTPAQAMIEQANRNNMNNRRDRDIPGYDFNLSVGRGSTGKIYETSGYTATFGGLSSY